MIQPDKQQQYKNFTIKAVLVASLCALAFLVAQNASLNSKVSQLQGELNLRESHNGLDSSENENNLRSLKKVTLPRQIVEYDENEEESSDFKLSYNRFPKNHSRRRSLQEGKSGSGKSGSGKGGTGKSSKSSKRDCSSSRTGDSEEHDLQCEDLQAELFALTSEIGDLEAETLRFNSLADELQQTSIIARADDNRLRKLQEGTLSTGTQYGEELNSSLRMLENQKNVLKTGNERVSELNTMLREAAVGWIDLNSELTDENLALLANVTGLTEENLALLAERSRLNEQIDMLSSTIDDYKEILEKHGELNGELNATTIALEQQIDRLEASNAEYKRLNEELSSSIDELEEQNTALAEQNAILAGLNQDLNATIDRLDDQVDRLEGQVSDLGEQNDALEDQVDRLEDETNRLKEVNEDLEGNVEELKTEVDRFVNKTEQLEKLNGELENIVSFIDETGSYLDQTMDTVTEFLSEQIVAYRSVATLTLKNTYIQRAALWDCAFADHFGDHTFASNENLAIPSNMIDEVFDYVGERVLEESCLSLDDFRDFLTVQFPTDPPFSKNHIVSGVASYTYLAYDYYFPDVDEANKLTEADWAMAGYNCQRLPTEKQFLHAET